VFGVLVTSSGPDVGCQNQSLYHAGEKSPIHIKAEVRWAPKPASTLWQGESLLQSQKNQILAAQSNK
jgi:hypothetical protein